MDSLLLHQTAHAQLKAMQADPPQGLLITGPTGMGKLTVAKEWASGLTSKKQISVIEPDEKSTITIETIRRLYQTTRSKHEERQVVIIHNAQAMGIEAQNAFLKLLEEPNAKIIFILTAPTSDVLLPTITSRVQQINLPRLSQKQLQPLINTAKASEQELAQMLFIANGRPAALAKLLNDPEAFAHYKFVMQRAKHLLSAGQYERLATISELAKDRQETVETLEAVAHMLHSQLLREQNTKLTSLADNLEICLVRLAQNGNPRAQLTALFTSY